MAGERQNTIVTELTAKQAGARRAVFSIGEIDEFIVELISGDLHIERAVFTVAIERKQTVDRFKLFGEPFNGLRFVLIALVLGECGRTRCNGGYGRREPQAAKLRHFKALPS